MPPFSAAVSTSSPGFSSPRPLASASTGARKPVTYQRDGAWGRISSANGRMYAPLFGANKLAVVDTTLPNNPSVIVPTQENFAVVHMVKGDSAPQPPPPGSGPYGPGCVIGDRTLGKGG